MKYKCFVFDLDGTLINSSGDLAVAVNSMRRHYGLTDLSEDLIVSFIGNGARKLAERSIDHDQAGVDHAEATETMLDYYKEKICVKTDFYPTVLETLKTLREAGAKMVVFTNKPQASTDLIAETLGFDKIFDLVMGPEEAGGLKPDPAGLERVMKDFGLAKEDILMIGDHHTDLHAAGALGIDSCFVTYGFGKTDDAKPKYIIDEMSELLTKVNS